MSTTTAINGWTVPTTDDTPDIGEIATLANAIDQRVIPIFSTTGARDSAIVTPTQGQVAYVTGTGEMYVYNGTAWVSLVPRLNAVTAGMTNTTTTFQNMSSGGSMSVEANSKYYWRSTYTYIAPYTTGRMKLNVTVPTGSGSGSADFRSAIPGGTATGTNNQNTSVTVYGAINSSSPAAYAATGNAIFYIGSGSGFSTVHEEGLVSISSTAGTFQVQFALCDAAGNVSIGGGCLEMWKVG